MSRTFTVRGVKLRSQSSRRYVAVCCFRGFDGVRYGDVKRVEIFKRSDFVGSLEKQVQRYLNREGFHSSRFFVIVDTVTGEEVG